jgi:hypothetical protein
MHGCNSLTGRARGLIGDPGSIPQPSAMDDQWISWRCGVLAVIRHDWRHVLGCIGEEDIDWDAWRPLYEEGHSPQAAVDRAFVRDL